MLEHKIPTVIGLLLVGCFVVLTKFGYDYVRPMVTRASEQNIPTHVTFSNISDTSFTVSWLTKKPTTGSIRMHGALPYSFFFDERFSGSQKNSASTAYTTHAVTIRGLTANTKYTFAIISDGSSFTHNGTPFEIHTGPSLTGIGTGIEPAYGQLFAPSGEGQEGGIVYLTLENGQTLSTLTKASGTWVIPLNLVRTSDLTKYMSSTNRIDTSLIIRTSDGDATALTDTLNDNPVPAMSVGKSYDFRKIQAEKQPNTHLVAVPSPAVLGKTTQHQVALVRPTQGAAIPSNLPLFQGTGIPGNQVLITIGMTHPTSDTLVIGQDGIWRYTPKKPLQEGKQSVTITSKNAQNISVALTHTFEILQSGTQVLGDATPSATLTPTPTVYIDPIQPSSLAGEAIPETGFPLPLIILLMIGVGLLSTGAITILR